MARKNNPKIRRRSHAAALALEKADLAKAAERGQKRKRTDETAMDEYTAANASTAGDTRMSAVAASAPKARKPNKSALKRARKSRTTIEEDAVPEFEKALANVAATVSSRKKSKRGGEKQKPTPNIDIRLGMPKEVRAELERREAEAALASRPTQAMTDVAGRSEDIILDLPHDLAGNADQSGFVFHRMQPLS